MPEPGRPCPACGAATDMMPTCHTWANRRPDGSVVWMACMGCDSAMDYYCTADDCRWDYTHGLNPQNPRAADNATRKPGWLP